MKKTIRKIAGVIAARFTIIGLLVALLVSYGESESHRLHTYYYNEKPDKLERKRKGYAWNTRRNTEERLIF